MTAPFARTVPRFADRADGRAIYFYAACSFTPDAAMNIHSLQPTPSNTSLTTQIAITATESPATPDLPYKPENRHQQVPSGHVQGLLQKFGHKPSRKSASAPEKTPEAEAGAFAQPAIEKAAPAVLAPVQIWPTASDTLNKDVLGSLDRLQAEFALPKHEPHVPFRSGAVGQVTVAALGLVIGGSVPAAAADRGPLFADHAKAAGAFASAVRLARQGIGRVQQRAEEELGRVKNELRRIDVLVDWMPRQAQQLVKADGGIATIRAEIKAIDDRSSGWRRKDLPALSHDEQVAAQEARKELQTLLGRYIQTRAESETAIHEAREGLDRRRGLREAAERLSHVVDGLQDREAIDAMLLDEAARFAKVQGHALSVEDIAQADATQASELVVLPELPPLLDSKLSYRGGRGLHSS